MNVERMLGVADAIEREEKARFNMGTWVWPGHVDDDGRGGRVISDHAIEVIGFCFCIWLILR